MVRQEWDFPPPRRYREIEESPRTGWDSPQGIRIADAVWSLTKGTVKFVVCSALLVALGIVITLEVIWLRATW